MGPNLVPRSLVEWRSGYEFTRYPDSTVAPKRGCMRTTFTSLRMVLHYAGK